MSADPWVALLGGGMTLTGALWLIIGTAVALFGGKR